jgi:hypothetical protein
VTGDNRIVEIGETADGFSVIFAFDPTHPIDNMDFHRSGTVVPRYMVSVGGRIHDILSMADLDYLRKHICDFNKEESWDVIWTLQHLRRLDKLGQRLENMKKKAAEFRAKLTAKKVPCIPEI